MPNYNLKRIERDIEKNIPIIIQREAKDELLKSITITGCELTHDLSFCKVYFTSLINMERKDIEKEVNEAASFIRGQLSKLMDIRNTPSLKFVYDNSIDYANHIEEIITEIHNDNN